MAPLPAPLAPRLGTSILRLGAATGLLALSAAMIGIGAPAAADAPGPWHQWQGPARTGAVQAPGTFRGEHIGLEVAWRQPLGSAVSALAVGPDQLFTLSTDFTDDHLVALDPQTGEVRWRTRLETADEDAEDGPTGTPATDGERVFVITTACRLMALDAAQGKVLYTHDLVADLGGIPRPDGCTTAPLLDGGDLIVQVGGREGHGVSALDPATGERRWSAAGIVRSTKSSPVAARLGGVDQVIVHHWQMPTARGQQPRSGVYGIDRTGRSTLWQHVTDRGFGLDTPLVVDDSHVLMPNWTDSVMVRVSRQEDGGFTAQEAWRSRAIIANLGMPVAHDGFVYGFGQEDLSCLDARTGSVRWQERVYPGTVILVDGHLVVLSQHAGLLRVVRATPEGYHERARLELFTPGAPVGATPAFGHGMVFVRNLDEVVAVRITDGGGGEASGR